MVITPYAAYAQTVVAHRAHELRMAHQSDRHAALCQEPTKHRADGPGTHDQYVHHTTLSLQLRPAVCSSAFRRHPIARRNRNKYCCGQEYQTNRSRPLSTESGGASINRLAPERVEPFLSKTA